MKSALMIVVFLALLLAACQPATPTETEAPAPIETQILPPAPVEETPGTTGGEPYPAAAEPGEENTDQAYPGPGQGSTPVVWEEATQLILEGKVAEVTQYDNLIVILVLKDGQTVSTREPVIDEVFNLIEQCGEKCEDIEIPTS